MSAPSSPALRDCDYCGFPWDLGEPDAVHVMGERKCCPDCRHPPVDNDESAAP